MPPPHPSRDSQVLSNCINLKSGTLLCARPVPAGPRLHWSKGGGQGPLNSHYHVLLLIITVNQLGLVGGSERSEWGSSSLDPDGGVGGGRTLSVGELLVICMRAPKSGSVFN